MKSPLSTYATEETGVITYQLAGVIIHQSGMSHQVVIEFATKALVRSWPSVATYGMSKNLI